MHYISNEILNYFKTSSNYHMGNGLRIAIVVNSYTLHVPIIPYPYLCTNTRYSTVDDARV